MRHMFIQLCIVLPRPSATCWAHALPLSPSLEESHRRFVGAAPRGRRSTRCGDVGVSQNQMHKDVDVKMFMNWGCWRFGLK